MHQKTFPLFSIAVAIHLGYDLILWRGWRRGRGVKVEVGRGREGGEGAGVVVVVVVGVVVVDDD